MIGSYSSFGGNRKNEGLLRFLLSSYIFLARSGLTFGGTTNAPPYPFGGGSAGNQNPSAGGFSFGGGSSNPNSGGGLFGNRPPGSSFTFRNATDFAVPPDILRKQQVSFGFIRSR